MSNLEFNLTKRMESVFQETKKDLEKQTDIIYKEINPKSNKNGFAGLSENFGAMKGVLEKLPTSLLEIGNNTFDNFEKEIKDIPEPLKSKTMDELKELITSEIQEIVRTMMLNKFHE